MNTAGIETSAEDDDLRRAVLYSRLGRFVEVLGARENVAIRAWEIGLHAMADNVVHHRGMSARRYGIGMSLATAPSAPFAGRPGFARTVPAGGMAEGGEDSGAAGLSGSLERMVAGLSTARGDTHRRAGVETHEPLGLRHLRAQATPRPGDGCRKGA